jgi:hypothetical protein
MLYTRYIRLNTERSVKSEPKYFVPGELFTQHLTGNHRCHNYLDPVGFFSSIVLEEKAETIDIALKACQ